MHRSRYASGGDPAEWGGLVPYADWDMVNAIVTSGSDIDSVPDTSGRGNSLTGVASNKPQRVAASSHFNNKPSAAFTDGTAQRFTFANLGLTANVAAFALVTKGLVDRANNAYAFSFANDHVGIFGDAATDFINSWASADLGAANSNNSKLTASVVLLTINGTGAGAQQLYVNSTTAEAAPSNSTGVTSTNGVIGNYASGPSTTFVFGGEMPRIIVFGSVPSSVERANIMNGLGNLYGITIS